MCMWAGKEGGREKEGKGSCQVRGEVYNLEKVNGKKILFIA